VALLRARAQFLLLFGRNQLMPADVTQVLIEGGLFLDTAVEAGQRASALLLPALRRTRGHHLSPWTEGTCSVGRLNAVLRGTGWRQGPNGQSRSKSTLGYGVSTARPRNPRSPGSSPGSAAGYRNPPPPHGSAPSGTGC